MGFFTGLLASVADKVAGRIINKVEDRLDSYFSKKNLFDREVHELTEEAMQIKEQIKIATTDEERDVLLDMQDKLFRKHLKFK